MAISNGKLRGTNDFINGTKKYEEITKISGNLFEFFQFLQITFLLSIFKNMIKEQRKGESTKNFEGGTIKYKPKGSHQAKKKFRTIVADEMIRIFEDYFKGKIEGCVQLFY